MENSPKVEIVIKKVKPEFVAQKCPVCGSFGTLGYAKKVCHACEGKGYILLRAEEVKR